MEKCFQSQKVSAEIYFDDVIDSSLSLCYVLMFMLCPVFPAAKLVQYHCKANFIIPQNSLVSTANVLVHFGFVPYFYTKQ